MLHVNRRNFKNQAQHGADNNKLCLNSRRLSLKHLVEDLRNEALLNSPKTAVRNPSHSPQSAVITAAVEKVLGVNKISVVFWDSKYYTMDNRRLWCLKTAFLESDDVFGVVGDVSCIFNSDSHLTKLNPIQSPVLLTSSETEDSLVIARLSIYQMSIGQPLLEDWMCMMNSSSS